MVGDGDSAITLNTHREMLYWVGGLSHRMLAQNPYFTAECLQL